MGMVERVARAIEEAARKSVPWPDREVYVLEDDDTESFHPLTLENFVNDTYIGPADEVFRAAALAGARAAIEAMREPTQGMMNHETYVAGLWSHRTVEAWCDAALAPEPEGAGE